MKRTSIRYRLMILMICLTTLPVVMITWIATHNTRDSVEKEMIEANRSRMLWADQYVQELMEQVESLFYTLQINSQFMNDLQLMDSPELSVQYRTQKYIQGMLHSAFHANSRKISNLTLYIHSNQKAYTVSHTSRGAITSVDIQQTDWSRMLHSPVNLYFKPSQTHTYAYHSINRFIDQSLIGGFSVRINRDVWEEVGTILDSGESNAIYVVNDEGQLLSGSSTKKLPAEIRHFISELDHKHSELTFKQTEENFYFLKKVGDGQITIVKAIPIETVNKTVRPTIKAAMITSGLFAAVSVVLSILFSLRITTPIVKLVKTMRKAQVQNFQKTKVQSRDEIGQLENGYNLMMERIRQLIENEYEREIEVKNAQIMAMQAQINPHFLNNTLNLIGGMALAKDSHEIYQITKVVGDLLRYSISMDDNLVLLEKELTHMRNYLFIHEQRFAGRCSIHIDVDEAALTSRLPKFTLQPIVENAFEHGLQRKEGRWQIRVQVKQVSDRIAVIIQDDGIGMSRARLHELRQELKKGDRAQEYRKKKQHESEEKRASRQKGIGLHNVHHRLRLQFGERYGLRLFSQEGKGTIVIIVLPHTIDGGEGHV
ncbi:sensor histidine kinase [Marinicrinis sediminis]|uniref:Sensor histidine kinase n=1 Tax=Marinicrinis sediminis TaxID=1652465 RepID=A0ABW5R918_9BACL